jgi:hypothetical protein
MVSTGAAYGEPATSELRFRANVIDLVVRQQFSGTFRPVHFDPRFVLTLKIESIDPAVPELPVVSLASFGIHSPKHVFVLEKDLPGRHFHFSLTRIEENGNVRFIGLEVIEKTAEPGATANPDPGQGESVKSSPLDRHQPGG